MKQPVSCGFLIVKGDPVETFLLMKHPKRWDLPKGHVDPGETEMECALRELHEETGITPDLLQIDDRFCFESRYPVNGSRYGLKVPEVEKTLKIFLARLDRDVDISVTEHAGYEWFPWKPPHRIQEKAIDPLLAYLEEFLSNAARASRA
ncbi:MAG: NUDIX domain-containing protein [Planctomycetaceae bacterium]